MPVFEPNLKTRITLKRESIGDVTSDPRRSVAPETRFSRRKHGFSTEMDCLRVETYELVTLAPFTATSDRTPWCRHETGSGFSNALLASEMWFSTEMDCLRVVHYKSITSSRFPMCRHKTGSGSPLVVFFPNELSVSTGSVEGIGS